MKDAIDVTLLYGRDQGGHGRRQGLALGVARLPVAATTGAFAPLVAVAKAARGEREVPFRHHDNKLWQPWTIANKLEPDTLAGAMVASEVLLWGECTFRERPIVDAFGVKRIRERAWARGPDFSSEPAVARIAWKARDLLFVDGILHQRTVGPRYQITRNDGPGPGLKVRIEPGKSRNSRPSMSHITIRPWELAQTVDALHAIGIDCGETDDLVGHHLVMDRDAVETVSVEASNLLATATEAMCGLGYVTLREADRETVEAMVSLMEATGPYRTETLFERLPPDRVPLVRAALLGLDANDVLDRMTAPAAATVARAGMRLLGLDPRAQADHESLVELSL